MIYTITLNPSLDYTLFLKPDLSLGSIHRTETYQLCAGGKGLNVSMILNQLQVPSVAYTFLGGFTGQKIADELKRHALITCEPTWIQEENRINVKIRDTQETDINLKGPAISLDEQKQFLSKLDSIHSNDWVLICGSFPKNTDIHFLHQIALRVHQVKAKLILDGIDLTLEDLDRLKPTLIKPNLDELRAFYPNEKITLDNYRSYAFQIYKETNIQVLVSLGSQGAYYCGQQGEYQVIQPALSSLNTVGAGDSMVAGMVSVLSRNGSIEEALCLGAAAGAATASSVGLSTLDQILSQQKSCSVIKLM